MERSEIFWFGYGKGAGILGLLKNRLTGLSGELLKQIHRPELLVRSTTVMVSGVESEHMNHLTHSA
jgi:hypothetical protein